MYPIRGMDAVYRDFARDRRPFCGVRALLISLILMSGMLPMMAADPVFQPRAHAHNDYRHDRPLLDALDHGFGSVEADVFLVDGKLLVAHDLKDVSPDRTLKKLYLDPLKARVAENEGLVFPGSKKGQFHLLIDFKSEAESTYQALNKTLEAYVEMLTVFEKGKRVDGAVTVVVSGNRPLETMMAETRRLSGYDGRIADLKKEMPAGLVPWISDNWGLRFKWRAEGPFPEEERKRLEQWVKQCHERDALIRFWGVPDKPAMWSVLQKAGVDLINTDDLPGLSGFLGQSGNAAEREVDASR